jgi:hypothetical protein
VEDVESGLGGCRGSSAYLRTSEPWEPQRDEFYRLVGKSAGQREALAGAVDERHAAVGYRVVRAAGLSAASMLRATWETCVPRNSEVLEVAVGCMGWSGGCSKEERRFSPRDAISVFCMACSAVLSYGLESCT